MAIGLGEPNRQGQRQLDFLAGADLQDSES